jgi:Holliday junction resolvasome RuvABC endonuclease subunit
VTLRIMGLDLSANGTGVCLPDGRVVRVPCKSEWGDARLTHIRNVIRLHAPSADVAVIEGMGRFLGNTGLIIAMVHGAVRTELRDQGVPYAVVTPATLKKFATGNGGAGKDLMMAAARSRAGLAFRDNDTCDAWWLREAGLDHYRQTVTVRDPDPERSRLLDKAKWPLIDIKPPSVQA